jgi:hypothetical protein
MSVDGTVRPLIKLVRYYPLKYCPQASSGFYYIQFTIVPEESVANYCPLDTTNFYDFAVAP